MIIAWFEVISIVPDELEGGVMVMAYAVPDAESPFLFQPKNPKGHLRLCLTPQVAQRLVVGQRVRCYLDAELL